MPLAGHDHVDIAIEAQFAGMPGLIRHQTDDTGDKGRLTFLATKCAAHTPAFNDNVFRLFAYSASNPVLHLSRVLRGTVDDQVAILCRLRHGNLAFEIKLVLTTQADVALQAMLGITNGLAAITALQRLAR